MPYAPPPHAPPPPILASEEEAERAALPLDAPPLVKLADLLRSAGFAAAAREDHVSVTVDTGGGPSARRISTFTEAKAILAAAPRQVGSAA